MTVPDFDGDPGALRAAASTLERLADDLRSEHSRLHAARESLGGARWSGPASLAFDQSVWWLGTQVYTAFDKLERGAGAIREYAEQLEDQLARYERSAQTHRSHTDRARMAETPEDVERHTLVASRAAGNAEDAVATARAAGDRCAAVLDEVSSAAAIPWRDWDSFTGTAVPEGLTFDPTLAAIWGLPPPTDAARLAEGGQAAEDVGELVERIEATSDEAERGRLLEELDALIAGFAARGYDEAFVAGLLAGLGPDLFLRLEQHYRPDSDLGHDAPLSGFWRVALSQAGQAEAAEPGRFPGFAPFEQQVANRADIAALARLTDDPDGAPLSDPFLVTATERVVREATVPEFPTSGAPIIGALSGDTNRFFANVAATSPAAANTVVADSANTVRLLVLGGYDNADGVGSLLIAGTTYVPGAVELEELHHALDALSDALDPDDAAWAEVPDDLRLSMRFEGPIAEAVARVYDINAALFAENSVRHGDYADELDHGDVVAFQRALFAAGDDAEKVMIHATQREFARRLAEAASFDLSQSNQLDSARVANGFGVAFADAYEAFRTGEAGSRVAADRFLISSVGDLLGTIPVAGALFEVGASALNETVYGHEASQALSTDIEAFRGRQSAAVSTLLTYQRYESALANPTAPGAADVIAEIQHGLAERFFDTEGHIITHDDWFTPTGSDDDLLARLESIFAGQGPDAPADGKVPTGVIAEQLFEVVEQLEGLGV